MSVALLITAKVMLKIASKSSKMCSGQNIIIGWLHMDPNLNLIRNPKMGKKMQILDRCKPQPILCGCALFQPTVTETSVYLVSFHLM